MGATVAATPVVGPSRRLGTIELRTWALMCVALGISYRLAFGWTTPLWLDETFTAVIATTPDFSGLLRWMLGEVSGPAFYLPAWIFEKLLGDTNVALRAPWLAASIATPLFVWWRGHRDAQVRWVWAALIALWLPALGQASEARPYALLLLLGCLQTMAFVRMMARPATATALPWAIVSALAILTHYHAIFIAALQGFFYLALGGRAAWRSWPAAFVFVPVIGWMAVHLPFVLRLMAPGNTWFPAWTPLDLIAVYADMVGAGALGVPILALIVHQNAQAARALTNGQPTDYSRGEIALAASALLAMAIVCVTALVKPSFTPRYLIPACPALLYSVALVAVRLRIRRALAVRALLALFAVSAIVAGARRLDEPRLDKRMYFNFENPTAWIMQRRVERLVFLWDNPTADASPAHSLAPVGSFFFKRANAPVDVVIPRMSVDADPNFVLPRIANRTSDAIIWTYDIQTPRTRGARHPARIATLGARFECRDFGYRDIAVVACRPK